jgi:hypothetical protein
MYLLRLYLITILRPVVVGTDLFEQDEEADAEREEAQVQEEHKEDSALDSNATAFERSGGKKLDERTVTQRKKSNHRTKAKGKGLSNIQILDPSGPKLMHGFRKWFILYQLVGQLNWSGKPLIVSIIYKLILIPACVYVIYQDLIKSMVVYKVFLEFRNPIFVFISLSALMTIILLSSLTFYNNLFYWCPIFKVLTTEKLCFVSREVQEAIGNNLLPPVMTFYIISCILFRMLTASNFEEFLDNFNILGFITDLMALLCIGAHLIGMSRADFYIRACFAVWILAMKTNLENGLAYFQRHEQVMKRYSSSKDQSYQMHIDPALTRCEPKSSNLAVSSCSARMATSSDTRSNQNDDRYNSCQTANPGTISHDSLATLSNSAALMNDSFESILDQKHVSPMDNAGRVQKSSSRMTLDEFKAKYQIKTMDEIQKHLNAMDDHLEVSRNFQNGSLVLITLSAFLINGSLLLLAYYLLVNQGDYFHGFVVVILVLNYKVLVFMCYIGDSCILYALESFVQTVEDEYFLQSVNDDESAQEDIGSVDGGLDQDQTTSSDNNCHQTPVSTTSPVEPLSRSHLIDLTDATTPAAPIHEAGTEMTRRLDSARQYRQLFIIKKRDVLFCREFLNQFQDHLATPWSKLSVKIQLHMVRTFATLIAALIIFDREH